MVWTCCIFLTHCQNWVGERASLSFIVTVAYIYLYTYIVLSLRLYKPLQRKNHINNSNRHKWRLSTCMRCLRKEWYWSYVRSWGLAFHKSNIFGNANSYMLEILINEYQVAFSPWSRYVAFWNEIIQSSGIRHISVWAVPLDPIRSRCASDPSLILTRVIWL